MPSDRSCSCLPSSATASGPSTTRSKCRRRSSGALAGQASCRGSAWARAYCCSIRTLDSRRTLVPQLMPMPVAELSWRTLLRVSVDALWVKKLAHGDQEVRDFAAKTLLDRHDDGLLGVPETIEE
ncbi:hypothetical protein Ae201684P_012071 [Aphanomyces euteiches]|uniref:Uncharacterized protein n=1 Tax=Aphanomyces euteiches TaxID=100861 RepID=A0A6G0WJM2_9STRA|nr:hypothetical protein Ae201684_014652 [Aphanomyces euteiches]KAH9081098.1 hypothetical protein Ae201684P_012071 [Aphanomyces euteiches]